ncbi:MAG TPA: ribosome maturation factor RimP [Candidatus Hydrogenedentes bacterium]|nr:ribosome maturation factor RimP [Candidatus Hydrogenedentota bacterium]
MEHEVLQRALWALLEPELARIGYELIEIELAGGGSRSVLRVFIDKPGGITLDDCVAASRQAELALDASDLMTAAYTLEMSSPGADRPLRKPEHFERYTGRSVRIHTHAPVFGRQRFTGVLAGVAEGMVLVQGDAEEPFRIHFENIRKARLEPLEQ